MSIYQSSYMIGKNPHQGAYPKILFVCSGGILRSATASHWAAEHKGWNTRAAGTHPYALIPVTQDLVEWADKIYVMMPENLNFLRNAVSVPEGKVSVLNIPDNYEYRSPELIARLEEALRYE